LLADLQERREPPHIQLGQIDRLSI
jgi:hypothetical protein